MPPEAPPALSIVMVLHASQSTLEACLRSLRQSLATSARLIAVDNASPDDSVGVLAREAPQARLVSLEENRGFAGGVNAGLPLGEGRYVMLLNPDVVVPEGGLERLMAWMDAHPEVGVGSPELVADSGHRESPGYVFPSAWPSLLEITRLHWLLPRDVRARKLRGPYWRGGEQLDADWVPGAAMIVRAEALAQVGPLDERFFMYGEDIEWCWRFRRAGWSVGVCADVAFAHQEGTSARTRWNEQERSRRVAEGIIAACARTRGRGAAIAYAIVSAASMAGESIHPRRSREQRQRTRTWLRAWLRAMRSVREWR